MFSILTFLLRLTLLAVCVAQASGDEHFFQPFYIGVWQSEAARFGHVDHDACMLVIDENDLYFYEKWADHQALKMPYSGIELATDYSILKFEPVSTGCVSASAGSYMVIVRHPAEQCLGRSGKHSCQAISVHFVHSLYVAQHVVEKRAREKLYFSEQGWSLEGKLCELNPEPYLNQFNHSVDPHEQAHALFCLNVRKHSSRHAINKIAIRGDNEYVRVVALQFFYQHQSHSKKRVDFLLETLLGDFSQSAKEYAASALENEFITNGDTYYSRGDYSPIIPHVGALLSLMHIPSLKNSIYAIFTREYGIACHLEPQWLHNVEGVIKNSNVYGWQSAIDKMHTCLPD